MKMRTAGHQVNRIGFAVLAFTLAVLACGAAMATEIERQIPAIRDSAGSGLTIEISREGNRQTATPFLTLNDPTVRRIEDRITKKTARFAGKEVSPEATVADSIARIDLAGKSKEGSRQSEAVASSLPPVPEEITVRSVEGFLKALRNSRKAKPAPAAAAPAPELRLGMAAAASR